LSPAIIPAQVQPPVVGQPGTPRFRSIEGTVLSSTGSPVPGAIVLLKNAKTLQVRSFIAQQDGRYHFYGLSMDVNWELRAENAGLTSKTRTISVFDSHVKVRLSLKLDRKMKT
jgi:Carboxypeptidase regulatory-like domain